MGNAVDPNSELVVLAGVLVLMGGIGRGDLFKIITKVRQQKR